MFNLKTENTALNKNKWNDIFNVKGTFSWPSNPIKLPGFSYILNVADWIKRSMFKFQIISGFLSPGTLKQEICSTFIFVFPKAYNNSLYPLDTYFIH